MKKIIPKFIEIEQELSKRKGGFNLFALFLRENSPNKWDLLVSADWVNENKSDSLPIISKAVQEKLEEKELMKLSRIVMIGEENPGLDELQEEIGVSNNVTELKDTHFFDMDIKHAYIITSQRNTAKAS